MSLAVKRGKASVLIVVILGLTGVYTDMVNPFIDDQAFESDKEYDVGIAFGPGGEEQGRDDWLDEDDPDVHNEDCLNHLDDTAPSGSQPQPRRDELTERLMLQYVKKRADSRPANKIDTPEEIDNIALKNTLYQKQQQIFWRVKCKTGREMDLVFEIMLHGKELLGAMPVASSSSTPIQTVRVTPPLSPAVRSLQIIRRYALTQDGEPKTIADELEKVLGTEWSVEWSRLIDVAGLEPGDDDVHAALSAVNLRAAAFLPVSVLQEADSPLPSTSITPNHTPAGISTILSAFSVPTVSGFIYIEGHCDEEWSRWLVQRSTVVKKSHSQIWIEPVECEDIGTLLDTPISSIQPMSWVRVKYGLYRGDVGLALSKQMRGGQRRFKVLLVPRLHRRLDSDRPPTPPPKPNHPLIGDTTPVPSKSVNEQSGGKRKRSSERPDQMLFHPKTFPDELTKITEDIYESNYADFRYGLVVKYYDSNSLSQEDVTMDTITRRFFGLSSDPLLNQVRLPLPDDWMFFAEEQVTAIVGFPSTDGQRVNLNLDLPQSTCLKNGVIVDAGVQSCTVQFWDYNDFSSEDTKISIPVMNLRKRIRPGDSVEVVAGEEKGKLGLVLSGWLDTVEVMESMGSECFTVHVNTCRTTARRNASVVPWLGRHVAVVYGQYRGYSGVVLDVNPPRPHYTMVDVSLANLGITVPVQHDFVVDSSSNQWLRMAFPLTEQQQAFRQPSWDAFRAPNMKSPPIDRYTGRYITQADLVKRQPPEPWIDVQIIVVRGVIKGSGTLRHVERTHQYPSGLRVLVEFDYISAEHGANPQYWRDYADIRDPRTGLPLHIVYPLKRERRYWEPLICIKAVPVKNPYTKAVSQPHPLSTPSTPLWSHEITDIFSTPGAGPSGTHEQPTRPISHWAVDPRLDQLSFFVAWKPKSGTGLAKVLAIPQSRFGKVQLNDGGGGWLVPPDEIHDLATPIQPTTVKDSLLVVRGPYTGTTIRPAFSKYVQGREKALIIGAVYEKWGTSAETYEGRDIEVEPENCALVGSDPNKVKFKAEIKEIRDRYRRPADGKKTRKRAIKPRGG
ncbi:hypothetical protein VKT23_020513 [Stygiomarasmius scandens]|uniref:KOW domain-containing protein n=1 Tax=Marasmiellus scandens TaxID=2682957 RepID=A0ABR1IMG9_9AGAR